MLELLGIFHPTIPPGELTAYPNPASFVGSTTPASEGSRALWRTWARIVTAT